MPTDSSTKSISCNLCGSEDSEELSTVDRDKNYLRTVICRQCGLVWTDPRPNEAEIKQYYSKDYRISYKGTYTPKPKHVHRAGANAVSRFRFIKPHIDRDRTILDVGAGGGEFVFLLRAMGFNAIGIEPNEGYAAYARTKLNAPVECGFIQQQELAPASLDVITLHHVFEHLDDPFATLGRLREALTENGIVVIEVPNVEATCYSPLHRFHAAHLYNFNPVTLEGMARKAGFSVLRSVVSADGGVVTAIFRRSENESEFTPSAENYRRVRRIVDGHTKLSHYSSRHPFIRPIHRLRSRLSEHRAVRRSRNGVEILNRIVDEYKRENNLI
ncbi:MAG: class I SAM-dependent methyltransferase [Acidobacteria bacterium]|nr:class I SAM-dependent methyltransferase [Acidobacteriota bacterium]